MIENLIHIPELILELREENHDIYKQIIKRKKVILELFQVDTEQYICITLEEYKDEINIKLDGSINADFECILRIIKKHTQQCSVEDK